MFIIWKGHCMGWSTPQGHDLIHYPRLSLSLTSLELNLMTLYFSWFALSTKSNVIMYMDDVIITELDPTKVNDFISLLNARFSLKDMETLYYFLGILVSKLSNSHLLLKQSKYTKSILDKTRLTMSRLLLLIWYPVII